MSKYIDAEWIRNIYADFEHYENRDDWTTPITNVLAVIDDAPSVDIVRCKECKHAHMTYGGDCKYCDMWKDNDDFCIELYLDGDFYCADGERKESE